MSLAKKPLDDLLAELGIALDPKTEVLDEITVLPDTEVDPEKIRGALAKALAASEEYGSALVARLRFEYPPAEREDDLEARRLAGKSLSLPLDSSLTNDRIDSFLREKGGRAPVFLDLKLEKRKLLETFLRTKNLTLPSGVRPALVLHLQALENLFSQSLQELEDWWDPQTPAKLVILAPEWQHILNGRYLAVVGKDPVEGWRIATGKPASGAPQEDDEALEPAEVYRACRTHLWWKETWTRHLTPLHLATEGDAPPGDPVADRLFIHLANLCLLFTADRTEGETDKWVCTFTENGERAEVAPVPPESPPASPGGALTLLDLVRWTYSRYLTSDRLGFLQSRIARELRGSLPSERYDLLLRQAAGIHKNLLPDWKMFMEGKVKEFSTQVKALEEDVAKTVESFSSQIAAMVKSLSDTMLAAVGVFLGAFIATLIKEQLRFEILLSTVVVYAIYLLVFPLTYNLRERWGSYQALVRQFEARRQRFEAGLSRDKVKQIVGDHVSRADLRFRRWFFLVAVTYGVAAILLVEAALVGLLWPKTTIDSAAYTAAPALILKSNEDLRNARLVGKDRLLGAEDVEVDAAGRLLTGTEDGRIVRITLTPDRKEIHETLADTGGRPLGLRFGPAGKTLFVADADKGLLAIDEAGGIKPLATKAGGVPFGFTDDLDIAPDGTIYFSDASSRFGVDEYLYDLLEARPHGRLLRYDPKAGKTNVLLDGLYFANGVALSRDQRYVLVNETYRYRIRRYWLKGSKAGTSDLFLKDLPGFPDNLSRDPETGHFWVALYTVRNPKLDALHPRPFLKNQLAKLPRLFWPKPEPYGLILEVDEQGKIVRSLHDPDGRRVRGITSVERSGDKLYLGSLGGGIAVVELGKGASPP